MGFVIFLPNFLCIVFHILCITGFTTRNIKGVAAAVVVAMTAMDVVVLTSEGEGRYSSTQVVDCSSVEITSLSLVVFGISGIGGVSRGGCSVFATGGGGASSMIIKSSGVYSIGVKDGVSASQKT